jgi:hypothetical protein
MRGNFDFYSWQRVFSTRLETGEPVMSLRDFIREVPEGCAGMSPTA